MNIKNNLFEGIPYLPCPKNTKPIKQLAFIVVHYTVSTKTAPTIEYLRKPTVDASAHIVIGRDGSITQLVPFDTQAWHAGESSYKFKKEQFNYLNNYSIGIELVNSGELKHICNTFYTSYGSTIPSVEVKTLQREGHENTYWHKYTYLQINSLIRVCKTLRQEYPQIKEIIGHSDITSRKIDPGKAFPWNLIVNI